MNRHQLMYNCYDIIYFLNKLLEKFYYIADYLPCMSDLCYKITYLVFLYAVFLPCVCMDYFQEIGHKYCPISG